MEKTYTVYVSALHYGTINVEAISEEEAIAKARKAYENRETDWHDEELTDLIAECD